MFGSKTNRYGVGSTTAAVLALWLGIPSGFDLRAQDDAITAASDSTAVRSQKSGKRYEAASVRALPDLECKLYPAGGSTAAAVPVFTDDDGYARFHAVRPKAESDVRQLTMDCVDRGGKASSYPVDLTEDATFAPRKINLAHQRGTDRPALEGDPMSYNQSQLIQAGYGLRPDPEKDPVSYKRWREAATRPGRSLEVRRHDNQSHRVTPTQGGPWVGSVMTGSPNYESTTATFDVPTAIPGGDGTTTTEIAIWNGLGGFGTGSGLIQGGVNLYTTPTVASYGTWREYCCGDPNSNGYGGAFVPNPGDKILDEEWYCDANGNPNVFGGYGCSFLYDYNTGAFLSCTLANGSPCWSVKALPLCSVSPTTPNCMTVGQAAEFIIENQSPQVSPTSTAFTDFTPDVTMSGIAYSATTSNVTTPTTDPTTWLLTDFTRTTTRISVNLSTLGDTIFSVSPRPPDWAQFSFAPTCTVAGNNGIKGVSRIPGSMEIWYICTDGSVWDAYWYEGFTQWNQYALAGPGSASVDSGITAVSRKPGTMEVWWVRPDGGVQDAYWYDTLNRWTQFPLSAPGTASVNGVIAAVSRKPETMEIWWVRPDGGVQDAYWYEGMAQWNQYPLSGAGSAATGGGIAAVSRRPETMEIWWVRPDGGVQDAYWYESLNRWNQYQLSGQGSASVSGGIAAVSRKPETMEIWWIRPDGGVQDAYWYEGFTQWNQYPVSGAGSASVTGGISAVSRQPFTMELWWVRPDGGVQDAYWYESLNQWNQFQLASAGSAAVSGGISGVSRKPETMELWWNGGDGRIHDANWY
jgi:hypothetical protein